MHIGTVRTRALREPKSPKLSPNLGAFHFPAGIVQKDPETAENDRLSVALGATSLPVGRPLTPVGTSPAGSFEPDRRPFCTIFGAENAYLAFSIPS